MLDENLPTFYLNKTKNKHIWNILLCQHGNEPDPTYSLRYPEPDSPTSKNRYASALYDSYVPDVLYGEVLIVPEFTQPNLSADAIRQNGGVAPPPEPILPTQFTIHLYNPDQQIVVRYKPKSWNTAASWEFEMPQRTFRQPSSSTLDRTQGNPASADITPKLKFTWRKDGKLSKDMTCVMSGKTSAVPENKKQAKSKEPDIIVSMFQGLRELTLYEPNLYRVEMEDFKGLEVVLLLGVMAIRDIYFTPIREAFRFSPEDLRKPVPAPAPAPALAPTIAASTPPAAAAANLKGKGQPAPVASGGLNGHGHPTGPQRPQSTMPQTIPQRQTQPPGQGPRPQQIPNQPPPQQKQDRQTRKRLEAEEQARRKKQAQKQAEIDQETRRLQQVFGREEEQVRRAAASRQQQRPPQPPRPRPQPHSYSQPPQVPNRNHAHAQRYHHYHHHSPSMPYINVGSSPYLAAPGHESRWQSSVHFASQPQPQPQSRPVSTGAKPPQLQPKKSSFFGFLKSSNEDTKLSKKRSSMF